MISAATPTSTNTHKGTWNRQQQHLQLQANTHKQRLEQEVLGDGNWTHARLKCQYNVADKFRDLVPLTTDEARTRVTPLPELLTMTTSKHMTKHLGKALIMNSYLSPV